MRRPVGTALVLLSFMAFARGGAPTLSGGARGGVQSQVEITAEPNHHQVFSNNYVRVFDVSAPSKASTLVHRHNYDYLFVTLGDSDVLNTRVGEKPFQLLLKDGEVRFTPGGFAHSILNQSDRVFRNITIELLQPSTNVKTCPTSCVVPTPCAAGKSACPTVERLITADQWTLNRVTLPASATLEKHTHEGPHLAVAISEFNLTQKLEDGSTREIHSGTGGFNWVKPVVHTIINNGSAPARFVALEFKEVRQNHP